jgi:predicted nucleic acid-binding protein
MAPARHERGVLDTSTVIMLPRLADAALLPIEPLITAVTLAELSVGPLVASSDAERAARQAHLQQAEADFDPLPFDAQSARAFGRVAASLRRTGRKPSARAYDAMIAATALANGLPVYTCNPDDFAGIEGLEVVPVPVPDSSVTSDQPADVKRRHRRRQPQAPGRVP